jgi:hypothetical protein
MNSDPLSLPFWAYQTWMPRANSPAQLPLGIERTGDGELFVVREVVPSQPGTTLRTWQRDAGESEEAFLARLQVSVTPGARLVAGT